MEKVTSSLNDFSLRWSLLGGPAAYELQHFYRGMEIPLFIHNFSDTTVRHLRLLPDAQGPITLLRSFGTLPYWKEIAGKTLVHPWLIYAELMHLPDPRAHEAAEELRFRIVE
jgi:Transcriptional regulator, AbiEi antitoxin, Type IV TA system